MLRTVAMVGAFTLASVAASLAQDATLICDNVGMARLQSLIDRERSQVEREVAGNAMADARASLKEGDIELCKEHMSKAVMALEPN